MSKLWTAKQVLEFFNVRDPQIVTDLVSRGLLPRIVLGPKMFRYEAEDCQLILDNIKAGKYTLK